MKIFDIRTYKNSKMKKCIHLKKVDDMLNERVEHKHMWFKETNCVT